MNVESDSREETPEVPQDTETGDTVVGVGDSAVTADGSTVTEAVTDRDETVATEGTSNATDGDLTTEPVSDAAEDQHEDDEEADDQLDEDVDVEPLELIQEESIADEEIKTEWYILKVQVNREESIRAALERKVKIEGLLGRKLPKAE